MSPRRARSAYSLYFRFRKNMHKTPTFQIDFECNDANRERYKAFVQRVLIGVWDDEANETQKYIGNNNFSDMSKQIGNDWKKVDDLTRSIFKELAVADDRRYKKVMMIFIKCQSSLTVTFYIHFFLSRNCLIHISHMLEINGKLKLSQVKKSLRTERTHALARSVRSNSVTVVFEW